MKDKFTDKFLELPIKWLDDDGIDYEGLGIRSPEIRGDLRRGSIFIDPENIELFYDNMTGQTAVQMVTGETWPIDMELYKFMGHLNKWEDKIFNGDR